MMSWIRSKFGPAVVSGIIGLIALVFIFSGVFNPRSTQGLHEGAVAGKVNGDSISIAEFNRELTRRVEFFKQMAGGKLTDEQLKAFRIKEAVFQELVGRKLMVQEAHRIGRVPAEEEIRSKIREIPVFQKDGQFDSVTYKQVLAANGYTPATFERMMGEDLMAQHWAEFFRARVQVSEAELKKEFQLSHDKRNIKFVLLTSDTGRKGVKVDAAEVEKFLKDPAKMNLAKSQYDSKKEQLYKNQAFDAVKTQIAHDLVAGEKVEEVKKVNQALAAQVLPLLKAEAASDAKINALLKPYGVTVKQTGLVSRQSPYLPGLGQAKDVMTDAFAKTSPIDPSQGGKAKQYDSAAWVAIAVVSQAERPDPAKLQADREKILAEVRFRKERAVQEDWMKKLTDRAKIVPNQAVVGDGGDAS